jgi:predicted nucleotidyltransferase
MRYQTVFHLISAISQHKGVPFVLIGGFAVNYYKVTRQTADIDFLITENGFKKISNLLEKEGYKEDYRQKVFTRLTTNSDYLVDLDFMFVDRETLSKIINKGSEIKIAEQKFIVPSLNHLIALKLHSIKNNPKLRMNKDLPDIIELIKVNKIDAKNKAFKDLCIKYGTQELYNEILNRI